MPRAADIQLSAREFSPGASDRFSVIRDMGQLERLSAEWQDLFAESGVRNPFAHPGWQITWARCFVAAQCLYVVTARDPGGKLIGVAPFYRHQRSVARGPRITQLRLLGTGSHELLTEIPQILTQTEGKRKILRDLMTFLGEQVEEWDWIEVSLTTDQGWFEPQWVAQQGPGANRRPMHRGARAYVVLPLAITWEELHGRLKRNVKESIRRGRNRLDREQLDWEIVMPDSQAKLDSSLDDLVDLHRKRSKMQGPTRHPDYFADRADEAFLYEVAHRMYASGHLTPCILKVAGEPVAARLVLHANGTSFLSVSGIDPSWWQYSPGTLLLAECFKRRIAQGDTVTNLSQGPDVSKLRWSEHLELHNDFLVVGRSRRSRLAFGVYTRLRAVTSSDPRVR